MRLRRLAVALLGCCALGSAALGVLLAESGLRPGRTRVSAEQGREAARLAQDSGAVLVPAAIDAADGVRLQAWFFEARDPRAATVLLTHGVTGHRGHTLALARLFLAQGYAVLAPDARAHGESGGDLATFGVRERDDLRRWIDAVLARRPGTCVVGVGASMGAAQLLQAAAVDRRLCGVVAESPFASFREVAFDRVGQRVHAGPWLARTLGRPAVEAAFLYVRWCYGADLGQASPLDAVRGLSTPVLLVHGTDDVNIPRRHADALARANPAIRVWLVEGGAHGSVWRAAGDAFPRRISEFVRRVSVPR